MLTRKHIAIQDKVVLLPLGVLQGWLPRSDLQPQAPSRVAHSQAGGESQGAQRKSDDKKLQDA